MKIGTITRYWIAPYDVGNSINSITFEEFKTLPKTKTIYLDTETTGLSFLTSKVIMIQLYFPGIYSIAIDTRSLSKGEWKQLEEMLAEAELVIGANIAFDYNMLKNSDVFLSADTFDVLDAQKLITLDKYSDVDNKVFIARNGHGRYSLAALTKQYTSYKMDKSVRKNFSTIGNKPFTSREVIYGLLDAELLEPVYKGVIRNAMKENMTARYKIGNIIYDDLLFSSEHSLVLADLEYNGIRLDKKQWLSNKKYFETQALNSYSKIMDHLENEKVELTRTLFDNLGGNYRKVDLNFKSSDQIIKFFKKQYGIELKDKFGKASASTAVLSKLKHPLSILILDYRKALKKLNAFGEAFISKYMDEDGKIRPSYNRMVGTFRVSARNPNMQQIPNMLSFRKAFIPDEDYYLLTSDYPQQEPHISGHKTQDPKVRDFYLTGHGDMHSFVASNMLTTMRGVKVLIPPKKEDSEEAMKAFNSHPDKGFRKVGKMVGLRMDYGGGPGGLAEMFSISMQEASKFMKAYFDAFPKKKAYFSKMQAFGVEHGFVYLNEISSIRRYFSEFPKYKKLAEQSKLKPFERKLIKGLRGAIMRKSINTPTQGTAAMMTKAAGIILRRKLIELKIKPLRGALIQLVLAVHDEMVKMCHNSTKGKYDYLIKYAMEEAALIFCSYIPMQVFPVKENYWVH